MYQAKSVVKKISLYCRGVERGSLDKNFFPQSEHVSSQIWCQNFFPLLGGGIPRQNIFFSSLNMYQAKFGVKNFFPLLGGRSVDKKFFSQSEHVLSQIWCQNFFPLLRLGTPPGPGPEPPYLDLDLGPPLPRPGLGTLPTQTWTWDPPLNVNRQTPVKTVPSRRTTYAGGNENTY